MPQKNQQIRAFLFVLLGILNAVIFADTKITIFKKLDQETKEYWESDKVEERLRTYKGAKVQSISNLAQAFKDESEIYKILIDRYSQDTGKEVKALTFFTGDIRTSGIYSIDINLSISTANQMTLSLENTERKFVYHSGPWVGRPIFDPQDVIVCEMNKLNKPNEFQRVFVGFINTINSTYTDGYHTLNIVAEDFTKLLRLTAINVRPSIFLSEALTSPTVFENPFVGKSLLFIILYCLVWTYSKSPLLYLHPLRYGKHRIARDVM